jgi:hypothetical protein
LYGEKPYPCAKTLDEGGCLDVTCVVPPSELPKDVQQLLREQIRSIEQLEILLLLREEPERHWTPADVYKKVRSSERSVEQTLNGFVKRGMATRIEGPQPSFHFAPQSPQLADTLGSLAHLYTERRVRIVEAIYSEPVSEVEEFAKAFRLRKDSNG